MVLAMCLQNLWFYFAEEISDFGFVVGVFLSGILSLFSEHF
jgi:hypothetical protein